MIQSLTKLDDLAKSDQNIGNELAALRQSILQLEKRVERGVALTDIGEETANEFASLIKLSSDSLIMIKSRQILEALSFSKLHQRYETVIKAHPETFDWIFQDNPDRSPKALREKMLFTNWLSSGDGIFYISGKPGSGKSTLMKFIYKNAKTRSLLDSWAAGRKVVLAKHFFWRPGEDTLEHSIVGLLQTLLHDVLEQCPELVPRVFPEQWIKIKDLPIHYGPGKIRIDRDDLYDAFDLFIDNCDLFENRCFFFMIDGLDEYRETANEGYKELIKLLSSWVTKIPGQLKLCVSSRELSVFLEHFSAVQGLRLQALTADDIHKYVKERLESNPNFLDMEKPGDGINKLISEITQKADGVFLWVALVVKVLDDACDEEDSFQGLVQKINFLPPEVWDLFDELFNSIHESDRIESAQTFAVALKMLQNRHGMRLSLLRYSLLDNYHSNPIFASNLDSLDLSLEDWNNEAIRRRIKRARKQLYKRCKGLLEVVESDDDPLPQYRNGNISLKGTPLSQRISLIHRSVQEYLEERKISEERAARTKNFDIVNAICQTYVAELTFVKRNQPDSFERVYCAELLDIIYMLSEAGQDAVPQESIIALQNLHKSRLRYIDEGKSTIDFIRFYEGNDFEPPLINKTFSVAHNAAFSGWYEFFETWTDPYESTLHGDIRNGSLALIAGHGSALRNINFIRLDRYFLMLRWLFEYGCSPNQAILNSHGDSVWSAFLTASFFHLKWQRFMFEAIEIYLEYGANPDFSFIIKKGDKENLEEEIVKVIAPVAVGASSIDSRFRFIHESFDKDNELFKLVSSRGGRATLRELFEDMRPQNVETILALIDRNLKAQQLDPQTPTYAEGTLPGLPPSQQEIERKELAEEPAGINKKPGLNPDDRDIELITAKQGDNMATLFKSLITNPLATFILGMLILIVHILRVHSMTNPFFRSISIVLFPCNIRASRILIIEMIPCCIYSLDTYYVKYGNRCLENFH